MARLDSGGKRGEKKQIVKGWYIDSVLEVDRPEFAGKTHIPIREYHFKRTNILSRRKMVILASCEEQAWNSLKISIAFKSIY